MSGGLYRNAVLAAAPGTNAREVPLVEGREGGTAGVLVAMEHAEVGHAEGELPVGARRVAEQQAVPRAVHGLQPELLLLHLQQEHVLLHRRVAPRMQNRAASRASVATDEPQWVDQRILSIPRILGMSTGGWVCDITTG